MAEIEPIPFVLGMFTVSGSPAFPALVLDDEAAISVDAIAPLAASLGMALTGTESVFGLLQNWDHNFRALAATVLALDDAVAGKYYRSAFTAVEFLTPVAPLAASRQVLCETFDGKQGASEFIPKLASAIVGPKAKIHLPRHCQHVVAQPRIGVVIGRPAYELGAERAASAIAGYLTVTDVLALDAPSLLGMHSAPSFLPIGPYFVPRAFAGHGDALDMRLTVNGEWAIAANLAARSETLAETAARLTQEVQLFPGDIVCCGVDHRDAFAGRTGLGDGDIIEMAVRGLGQQTLNSMRTSDDRSR